MPRRYEPAWLFRAVTARSVATCRSSTTPVFARTRRTSSRTKPGLLGRSPPRSSSTSSCSARRFGLSTGRCERCLHGSRRTGCDDGSISAGAVPLRQLARGDESAMRHRRSNRGGDDRATKIVFAIIILAIAGWVAIAWFHREHTATRPPADLQRRL